MKNFIDNVMARFKEKYDAKDNDTKSTFIDLPPDIKQSSRTSQYDNSDSDDIDNLATFVLSSDDLTSRQNDQIIPSNQNLKKGRWVTQYESITIHGRTIERGFIYVGAQLDTLVGYGIEPSLIDERLSVSPPKFIHSMTTIYSDESLGYWPAYVQLSPACRGIYLDWLASDRTHPNIPIGYVFIYFNGLERRVIESISEDNVSDDEFISLYNEVYRLHTIYGEQSSFYNYSARLLEFMTLVRSPLFEDRLQANQVSPPPANSHNLIFKMQLAKIVTLKQPVPTTLAWEWLVFSNEYHFKTPARRCASEFKDLFDVLYQKAYPKGFMVAPNKTKLKLNYNAASRAIGYVDLTLDDLQDASVLKAPVKKLTAIAEQCNEALDAYSRYLGRDNNDKMDIDAILLLPEVLTERPDYQNKYPAIKDFKLWAGSIVLNNEGLTTVDALWRCIHERSSNAPASSHALPRSLTKKHHERIINLAERVGFGVVPDPRYYQAKLKSDGYVVIFRGGHGHDFEPSAAFYQISLALRLGAMVATIDGHVDKQEVDTLLTITEQDQSLSSIEKSSLKAYLLWRLNTPSNMAGLKSKLSALSEDHVSFISHFIISVALADGQVKPNQVKQIEKLYQALGLDKQAVISDIHHITSNRNLSKTTTALNQKADIMGDAISTAVKDSSHQPFVFDKELLAAYESDTGDAKAMLASIFADEDIADDADEDSGVLSDAPVDDDTAHNTLVKGLDTTHSQLYQQLISKEVWQREEAEVLCESLNLMINGAIETINDWAFDNVDAPVLDDDDNLVIDFEIVDELKTLV